MRVGILEPEGSVPYRYVKKSAAVTLLRRLICSPVYDELGVVIKNVIREKVARSAPFPDPRRLEGPVVAVIPRLRPPRGPENLILQYPLRDDSSQRRQNRKRVWSLKRDVRSEETQVTGPNDGDTSRRRVCNQSHVDSEGVSLQE